jgi:hypothetical protein
MHLPCGGSQTFRVLPQGYALGSLLQQELNGALEGMLGPWHAPQPSSSSEATVLNSGPLLPGPQPGSWKETVIFSDVTDNSTFSHEIWANV